MRNGELQYYTDRNAGVPRRSPYYRGARRQRRVRRRAPCHQPRRASPPRASMPGNTAMWKCAPSCAASKGTWPAIWMMPNESSYGKWPRSGEIDILEHVGYDPEDTLLVHGALQPYARHPAHFFQLQAPRLWVSSTHTPSNGLPRPPDMALRRQGTVFHRARERQRLTTWPPDIDYYLIPNFAFGGGWGRQ